MMKLSYLLTAICSFVVSIIIYRMLSAVKLTSRDHNSQTMPMGDMQFCNTGVTTFDNSRMCSVFTLATTNLMLVPYSNRILETPYFRYFKVDLDKDCPFWNEPKSCYGENCSVKYLTETQVPSGLFTTTNLSDVTFPQFISERKIFGQWDSMQSAEFCTFDSEQSPGVFVDLLANPEGYTGYTGESARRIWDYIYSSGCGDVSEESGIFDWKECNEKKLFYRLISGLHASISTHIAGRYYNKLSGHWEENAEIFEDRVGRHPDRIENIFLLYLLLYRAINLIKPLLLQTNFGCDEPLVDDEIKSLITTAFNDSIYTSDFDSVLFSITSTSPHILDEFKKRFRKVTLIMDCIPCEKCRLWGKIQISGIGTALKVIFSSELATENKLQIKRWEIVSLFNTFGRLTETVSLLEKFGQFSLPEMCHCLAEK